MKPWPIFSLMLLAAVAQAGGQEVEQGEEALAGGLWEVAELHFRRALDGPALENAERARITLRLAEALIRGGEPEKAQELLEQSLVAGQPETPFWQAQALAARGRLAEAAAAFDALLARPETPHRMESGFTAASLHLALDHRDAALDSLARLLPGVPAAQAARVKLFQAEILLDADRPGEARAAMPEPAAVAAADRPLAAFLDARLLLTEDEPAAAQTGFERLLAQPAGQSLENHHAAAIGRAEAIAALEGPEDAAVFLLTFLLDHPGSPLLDAMFERILKWLPEKPSPTDPVLERIKPADAVLPATGLIAAPAGGPSAAVDAWPVAGERGGQTDLLAWKIYLRAVGLHRMGTPETAAEAQRLFNRLRIEFPGHFLANRARYQLARWDFEDGRIDRAFSRLNSLRMAARRPEMQGRAAFLQARAALETGNPQEAIALFEEAADVLEDSEARTAELNAALLRLGQGGGLVQGPPPDPSPELASDLALERALAAEPAEARRKAIEDFLLEHPQHPRAAEARLAAAEAALAGPAPDLSFARAQLETLAALPDGQTDRLAAPRLAMVRLRLADLSGDAAATQAAAQEIIDRFPAEPEAAEAAFTLGRSLFQAGNYNPALLVLKKLAAGDADPARSQAAWLLAARAAKLGGTPQSKEEARGLFERAIAADGPLTAIARLEQARHLIDNYELKEAATALREWTRRLPADDPLQLPAGLLLGEALYAQGGSEPESLAEALAIYDRLLEQAPPRSALFNRLQYLRGSTFEQLPAADDPTKRREKEAFLAYHSVLETDEPPAEWEYFERSGFRALALLEKAERWPVAITVAKKIASFNGPGAAEAAERASQLQLKHMIWED